MIRFTCTALTLTLLLTACDPAASASTALGKNDSIQQGYALIHDGQPEAAVSMFDRLIAHAPDNASAYNGKGVAFDHAGNHQAAQELYQKALSITPDSLSIRNNLAMSLILNGQAEEAVSMLEELNQQYPGNKTVRQNLALAYGITGKPKEALELNLQDLPPEQAHENMRFYKAYASRMKKLKPSELYSRQIGFAETHAPKADAIPEPSNTSEAPAPQQVDVAPAAAPAPQQPAATDSPPPSFPSGHRSISY